MTTSRLEINAKLLDLRAEHRQVDAQKKQKLCTKDQIAKLESMLIPNLDA